MVMLAGAVNVGGVLSVTVMIWSCVVVLPAQSVSDHVLVIVNEPGHAPATGVASVNVASRPVRAAKTP